MEAAMRSGIDVNEAVDNYRSDIRHSDVRI
jgi:hypothetical protein